MWTLQQRQAWLVQAQSLAILVILLSILAAILFGLFSLILPAHPLTVWRIPVLIAAVGVAALAKMCAPYSSVQSWVTDGLAAVFGLASAVLGIGISLLIAYGISLHIAENTGTAESLIYELTSPAALAYFSCYAIIAAVPGLVGLYIVQRRSQSPAVSRALLAAMAARFSKLGLSLSAVVGLTIVVGALPPGVVAMNRASDFRTARWEFRTDGTLSSRTRHGKRVARSRGMVVVFSATTKRLGY